MKLLRRLRDWLRPKMPVVNIGLALAAWWANDHVDQVFCWPVPWAAWTLGLTTSAFLLWPWLRRGPAWAQHPALFLQAVLLLVCLYCVWFFGWFAYFMALTLTVTFSFLWEPSVLFLWVPLLFGVQILKRLQPVQTPGYRVAFGIGIISPLLVIGWSEYQFREVEKAVERLPARQRQNISLLEVVVPRTYMAERLAGADFKYHNYFCIYDGVRPALYDPLVNVCLWLRGGSTPDASTEFINPLSIHWQVRRDSAGRITWAEDGQSHVNRQATLYHRLFPDRLLNAGCACTPGYGTITVQAE